MLSSAPASFNAGLTRQTIAAHRADTFLEKQLDAYVKVLRPLLSSPLDNLDIAKQLEDKTAAEVSVSILQLSWEFFIKVAAAQPEIFAYADQAIRQEYLEFLGMLETSLHGLESTLQSRMLLDHDKSKTGEIASIMEFTVIFAKQFEPVSPATERLSQMIRDVIQEIPKQFRTN